MFWHNYKYSLKRLLRNKALIFWTLLFPIILGTLFSVAFSNVEKSDKFSPIDIAIVNDQEFKSNEVLSNVYTELGKDTKDQVFNITYVTLDEAKELLDNKEVTGYLYYKDNEPNIVIKSNGIDETIFKSVVDEVNENIHMVTKIATEEINELSVNGDIAINYELIYQNASDLVTNNEVNLKDNTSNNLSYTMIEFYTLIAMTCLYGGLLGMLNINQNLANMSENGKRSAVSGISKLKLVISSSLSAFTLQLIGIALLMLYTIFALQADYGSNIFLVCLLAFVGSLAGLGLGVMCATTIKSGENAKFGIIIAVTMAGCFFAGMMGVSMKYMIDQGMPIINLINPAAMITDGFYALYYYDTYQRFIFDISSLLVVSFILFGISILSLRGQKYDNL